LKSPLFQIEPHVVSLIIQLANMRIPITTAQGLQLCNPIIQGTKFESEVATYKKNADLHRSALVVGIGEAS
jgi:hypothetical protein